MNYNCKITLSEDWEIEGKEETDDNGNNIYHIEASHITEDKKGIDCYANICIGDLPEDCTLEDQAFANYVDIVGFDSEVDENPLSKTKFNNKSALSFDSNCDDGSIMRIICSEFRKGILLIISLQSITLEKLNWTQSEIEKGLRIRK